MTDEEFLDLRRHYAHFWRWVLRDALGWADGEVDAYIARLDSDLVVHQKPGFWIAEHFIPDEARTTLDDQQRNRLYNDLIWAIDPSDGINDFRLPTSDEDVAALKARVRAVYVAHGISRGL